MVFFRQTGDEDPGGRYDERQPALNVRSDGCGRSGCLNSRFSSHILLPTACHGLSAREYAALCCVCGLEESIMGDVESPPPPVKKEDETDKASLTEDPKVGGWRGCVSVRRAEHEGVLGGRACESSLPPPPLTHLHHPPPSQEAMRAAIRRRHRRGAIMFLVFVFFILLISFLAFRQPKIKWNSFLPDGTDSEGNTK